MSVVYERSPGHVPDSELPPFPVRRWTVEEYMRAATAGVLDEDDNVELLEGWIASKMTKNPLHDSTIDQIFYTLLALLPSGWYLRIQNSLVTPTSVPEPDLCLVKGAPRDYCDRHPRGEDAALVVEVADSSLERDRMKCRIYARAGIAAYWIVNLIDRQIEVYSEISGEDGQAEYCKRQVLTTSDLLPTAIPGCAPIEVAVASLLT